MTDCILCMTNRANMTEYVCQLYSLAFNLTCMIYDLCTHKLVNSDLAHMRYIYTLCFELNVRKRKGFPISIICCEQHFSTYNYNSTVKYTKPKPVITHLLLAP